MEKLKENFFKLPGSNLEKLKQLHSELFSKVNWGRLVVFLNFADQLELTEEEWELPFFFLFPLSSRFDSSYIKEHQGERSHYIFYRSGKH